MWSSASLGPRSEPAIVVNIHPFRDVVLAERHAVKETQRADDLVERGQMNLKGADILEPQTVRGSIKISAELRNRVDVGSLGRRRKIADRHILDHATTQRADLGHLKASCLGVGCDTQILSDSRPITRPRRIRRDSGFVQSKDSPQAAA